MKSTQMSTRLTCMRTGLSNTSNAGPQFAWALSVTLTVCLALSEGTV